MSKPFPRRFYASPLALLKDFRKIVALRPALRRAAAGGELSPAFRERLMLAVTAVNECRYCSYYHAGQALRAGVPEQEMRALLAGDLPEDVPGDECAGLLYAQHWAEADGKPEAEARQRLVNIYGESRAQAIEAVLHMIRIGNLLGNSADYWLNRLSFGRFGTSTKRSQAHQPANQP